jgi:hypothetical protein
MATENISPALLRVVASPAPQQPDAIAIHEQEAQRQLDLAQRMEQQALQSGSDDTRNHYLMIAGACRAHAMLAHQRAQQARQRLRSGAVTP